jgi:hypothetical protein
MLGCHIVGICLDWDKLGRFLCHLWPWFFYFHIHIMPVGVVVFFPLALIDFHEELLLFAATQTVIDIAARVTVTSADGALRADAIVIELPAYVAWRFRFVKGRAAAARRIVPSEDSHDLLLHVH